MGDCSIGNLLGTPKMPTDALCLTQEEGQSLECEWKADEDGLWQCSECDIAWTFTDGGPEENELNYCPKCGRRLSVSVYYCYDSLSEDEEQ